MAGDDLATRAVTPSRHAGAVSIVSGRTGQASIGDFSALRPLDVITNGVPVEIDVTTG